MEAICVYGVILLVCMYAYNGFNLVWIFLAKIKIESCSDRFRHTVIYIGLTLAFLLCWPYICYKLELFGEDNDIVI